MNKENNIVLLNGNSNDILVQDIIKMMEHKYSFDNIILSEIKFKGQDNDNQYYKYKFEIDSDVNLMNENVYIFIQLNNEQSMLYLIDIINRVIKHFPKNIILVFTSLDQNIYYSLSNFFIFNCIYNFICLNVDDMIELMSDRKDDFLLNKIFVPDSIGLSYQSILDKNVEIIQTDETFADKIYDTYLKLK